MLAVCEFSVPRIILRIVIYPLKDTESSLNLWGLACSICLFRAKLCGLYLDEDKARLTFRFLGKARKPARLEVYLG